MSPNVPQATRDALLARAASIELHAPYARSPEIDFDLELDSLRAKIGAHASHPVGDVFVHVVNSATVPGGTLAELGAGPNFDGGVISLCSCSHGMRATLEAQEWPGRWVAGFTSYSGEFGHQQYLRYLMRVGEAFPSHHALATTLVDTGRSDVLDAKDASRHPSGDICRTKPGSTTQTGQWRASTYCRPVIGHAHRDDIDDETWHRDIEYVDRYGRRPALLMGDPGWCFVWSRPSICKVDPGPLRGHRRVSVEALLKHLRGLP